MSAVVDKWTRELAKLREKGQTVYSNGSSPASNDESQPKEGSSTVLAQALSRFKRVNWPPVLSSEASISMLDCFSA